MQDLLVFRLLAERAYADPRLPALLEELGGLSPRTRAPYFAWLCDAATAETAPVAVRAAALRAMDGADGVHALEVAARALDATAEGGEEALADAGIAVLRSAGARRKARLAHLLFHARPEIRRKALAVLHPDPSYEFYLLADEHTRAIVRARGAAKALPEGAISAALELHERGFLDVEETRALVLSRVGDLPKWGQSVRARPAEVVDAFLESAATDTGPDPAALGAHLDDIDGLLELFWGSGRKELFLKLATSVRNTPIEERVAVALMAKALRTGAWPEGVAGAIGLVFPPFFGAAWVAPAERRAALVTLYELGPSAPKRANAEVEQLLRGPQVMRADGTPDLWVAGALLHLATSQPFKLALDTLGSVAVEGELTRRPRESAPFLFAADDAGRRAVLELVARSVRLELLVELALAAPSGVLPFLYEIDGDQKGLLAPKPGPGWQELLLALLSRPIDPARADRLAEVAHARVPPAVLGAFMKAWLADPFLPGKALGLAVTSRVAAHVDTAAFVYEALALGDRLPVLLQHIASSSTFPYAKEMALAHALLEHENRDVAAWARERVPVPGPPGAPIPDRPIEESLVALRTCAEHELPAHVAAFVRGGKKGLAPALSARPTPKIARVEVCVALLASDDPIAETALELERFGAPADVFQSELDVATVSAYAYRDVALGLLGHAWLWRWDRHAFAFLAKALERYGDLASAVAAFLEHPKLALRDELLASVANALALLGSRDRERLRAVATPALAEALVSGLATDVGVRCAGALSVLHKTPDTRATVATVLPEVRLLLPDLDDAVRDAVSSWIDSEGLEAKRRAPPPEPELDEATVARIRGSSDTEELARLASSDRVRVVHEATLRLLDLGERGQVPLLALLAKATAGEVAARRPIIESVTLWAEGESLAWARVFCTDSTRPSELRFRVALALAERGEPMAPVMVAAAAEPSDDRWFQPDDWEKLTRWTEPSLALAVSPHPHAHMRAVEYVLEHHPGAEGDAALRAFLERGTKRMGSLRRRAASRLHEHGDDSAFPLVLEQVMDEVKGESTLLVRRPASLVDLTVRSIALASPNVAKEPTAQKHLAPLSVFDEGAQEGWAWLAEHASVDTVRAKAVAALGRGPMRARKVRAIAEAFAWGQERSRELTGRTFRVQMTGGKGLGYTRLRENRVFVSPMPILRGDRHGDDVVRGLVLHELGHHMYHRGKEREALWAEAQRDGIGGLLNLVADEHLERNVRAIDPDYGDMLKRLAAYAFQHAQREIRVDTLLGVLQGRSFEVLSGTHLGVARDPDSVVVESGALLRTMERLELPFARFVRALRMGLGNRSGDPLVEQGLELFRDRFRKGDMPDLLDVTRRLQSLYGWQVRIVEHFGTHESLEEGDGDASSWGISDDEIEREIERVTDPDARRRREGADKPGGRPWINIAPKTEFDRITAIKRMPYDASLHAPYARRVERHAQALRRYLEELGISLVPHRARTTGHRIDTSRLRGMVLRGDPRVLVARQRAIATDVFISIVIDCSGSMASRDNMERAKHFAVLIAEAARALRGVDVRVFGFTDKVIYDCGDAQRCAAHTLYASGGNNDAAALWHAANVAKQSQRRAKLLVMISDGLPTECSVDALRHLVELLGKREKMVCAQIAVQPISEVCFPHYVVVQDDALDAAVRRFGEILVRLVTRALAA